MDADRRRILIRAGQVGVLAVLGIAAVTKLAPADPSTSYEPAGPARPLPDQQLAPVTADEFGGILVGLRGTPVVVNVWASWCPPCRAEMPLLERAAAEVDDRVVILGVASKDSRDAAAGFIDQVGVDYSNVFDATGEVHQDLQVEGLPTTYFFDADGELREAVVGGVTEPQLAAQIDDLVR